MALCVFVIVVYDGRVIIASLSFFPMVLHYNSPVFYAFSTKVLEYPELGMEAIWKIEVKDFPAFVVVDDKGNDFFKKWQQ